MRRPRVLSRRDDEKAMEPHQRRWAELVCDSRNLTERKQLEAEREITIRLLRLLNAPCGLHELMREVCRLLQDWFDCEAVGIRLAEGSDYPYFETRGFSSDHVRRDSQLCTRSENGERLIDAKGNPILDCLCGSVLTGRPLSSHLCFTGHGSFCTGSLREKLAACDKIDSPSRMRGQCCQHGFESLALIPMRTGSEVVGLLQLNDRRKGWFGAGNIQLLEQLAESIAIAVSHRLAQEKLLLQARVLDQIKDTITVTDLTGKITYVNAAQARAVGVKKEDLIGQPVHILAKDPAAVAMQQHVLESTLRDGSWHGEVENSDATGERIIVDCRTFTVRDAADNPIALCGLGTDIRDRKRAEDALRESEVTYRTLVNASPDPIAVTDIEGKVLFASPRVMEVFGQSPSDSVLGRNVIEWVAPADREKATRNIGRVLSQAAAPEHEYTLLRSNGTPFSAEISGAPLLCADGTCKGMILIIRDVTERKRLEAQLRQAQKMEGIGQLAGGIAHDFNNILTAILMNLNLLQTRTDLDADLVQCLTELESQANRAAALTRQLLLFSRRSVMQVQALDLNEVVENLLKMLRRLIGEHIVLNWNGKSLLPKVLADSGMLEQVVLNLAVNARDAMPAGGRLTIATDSVELTAAQAQSNPEARPGRFVHLSISDSGSGMDEAVLKRLFEPFFTTKEAGKGTGLGLATVYGIVKQHQGWITVESKVEQGSVFRVFLPAVELPQGEPKVSATSEPLQGGSETLLVVEDDIAVRRMTSNFLRQLGYQVIEAINGVDALQVWKKHSGQIDLLLTDMVMPEGITGLRLAEQLRQFKPGLPVIISSGYSTDLLNQSDWAAKDIHYLGKPCPPKDLAGIIRRILTTRLQTAGA